MASPVPSIVEIILGSRPYRFGVPAGEAAQLASLGARVEAIFAEVKQVDPQVDRDRQWAITCLQLMAELAKAENRADDQQATVTRFHRHLAERLETLLP